jgi:hypothetical protein
MSSNILVTALAPSPAFVRHQDDNISPISLDVLDGAERLHETVCPQVSTNGKMLFVARQQKVAHFVAQILF